MNKHSMRTLRGWRPFHDGGNSAFDNFLLMRDVNSTFLRFCQKHVASQVTKPKFNYKHLTLAQFLFSATKIGVNLSIISISVVSAAR